MKYHTDDATGQFANSIVGLYNQTSAEGLELCFGDGGAHVRQLFCEHVDNVVLDLVVDFDQGVVDKAILVTLLEIDKKPRARQGKRGTRQQVGRWVR